MATERAYRRLRTDKDVKKLMRRYYTKSKILPRIPFIKPKIAWLTSGAPVELLYAFDVLPLYPENYGALVGALIIGVAAEVSTQWLNPAYKVVIVFIIMIATLLIRPRGIFGVRD